MKVAFIGTRGYPYVYSGYETFIKELCERLVERNVEVTVYCHRNLFKSKPPVVNGIKLKYLWTVETKSLSQLLHSVQAIIHACFSDADIIFAVNSANGPFGIIARLFGKTTAINVDGLEWLRPKWKGLGAKYFYWASKMSTKFFDHIVNDSAAMREVYLQEFQKDSTVIAYGANQRFSQDSSLISEWELTSYDYYLIVGRLIPDNNADVILREFIKTSSTKKLVIVGDVPYADSYATQIKEVDDPRVVFTGYVTDPNKLAELYHHCYVYFHGHEFGGTNPTLLKALAYGCAIMALDTVFTREVLDDGRFGVFFSKENGHLARVIMDMEKDDSKFKELREVSRKRIEECYTWENITDQYLDLFRRIMKD